MSTLRVALVSLGCKVNQNELEAIKQIFQKGGYQVVPFPEKADAYVIHTCTVTHVSARKSRQLIRRAVRINPDAVVAVSGCYAQVTPEEILTIPGVDVLVGTQDRKQLLELVTRARKEKSPINMVRDHNREGIFEELPATGQDRARAFVKIQEGCQQYCSYCIIPYARGPLRSRSPRRVLDEVQLLVEKGYQEIVLTGVHIGAYGQEINGDINLSGLLEQMVKVPGLRRLRLGSIEPQDFTPELKVILANEEVICPHFHIPLQSGDDTVLKAMGRNYTGRYFLNLVDYLYSRRSQAAITSDVMVGFPGETEAQFQNTLQVVEKAALADVHVFPYSPRQGTAAAKMPNQIAAETKKGRRQRLLRLGKQLSCQYARQFLNQTLEVLVEKKYANTEDAFQGHTPNYLLVAFSSMADMRGQLVPVKLQTLRKNIIWGQIKENVNKPAGKDYSKIEINK